MEFWFYVAIHWNSKPFFINIGTLAVFLLTLEFYPTFINICILTLSLPTFQQPDFCSYFYKYWHSDLILPTQEFSPYFYKHWNSDFILENIGILALTFINIIILIVSVQTLEFRPYPYKHWNSHLILPTFGMLALL